MTMLPGSSLDLADKPISAQDAVAALQDYAVLRLHHGALYGISFDVASGRNRLCRFDAHQADSLLPDPFSVRSRVHEYGGGAWCLVEESACFVNDSDQQIWRCDLHNATPTQLTHARATRFADLHYDAHRNRLIAVGEVHDDGWAEPQNRLLSVALNGQVSILAQGADFYSSPALSPDSKQVAWIEWDHPQQPWRDTRLLVANISASGQLEAIQQLSDCDAAWAQPRFSPDGRLHAVVDRDNWWRIESYGSNGWEPLPGIPPDATEFTTAPWQFGLATYGWDGQGRLFALGQCDGYTRLYQHDGEMWRALATDLPVTRMHSLAFEASKLACVAEFSDRMPAVISLDLTRLNQTALEWNIVYGGEAPKYPVSEPEPCRVSLGEGVEIPYFLYRPRELREGQSAPLVIYTHGGPSAATAPTFKPSIQYWTQRGFMIADVNYRGSTGFGRAYRLKLAENWGVSDVDDVEAVAQQLIGQHLADHDAVFIRGNSAGGYTTLCALAGSKLFRAGASLYGVSDPARLNQITHKFESRYLHWLIGDPETQASRYRSRSTLYNADRITAPVIFFQGERDRVVLPEQTRQMAESLRSNGIPVETHYFSDEAHGFRKAQHQACVLEQELAFYRRWMR